VTLEEKYTDLLNYLIDDHPSEDVKLRFVHRVPINKGGQHTEAINIIRSILRDIETEPTICIECDAPVSDGSGLCDNL
jgi:hypothetical protein